MRKAKQSEREETRIMLAMREAVVKKDKNQKRKGRYSRRDMRAEHGSKG